MFLKKITVFLLPDGENSVKQFRFPMLSPTLLLLLLIFFTACLFWFIHDYYSMKAQMPRLAQLEKETKQKKQQFIHLAKRFDLITHELGSLKEFDRKLKIMVNLQTNEDDESHGLGGPAPIFSDSQKARVDDEKELVRLMHRTLDNLENEIADGEQEKTDLYDFFENQKLLLAATPSIRPANGWMSSRFGYRISPFTGKREFHRGIDIATKMGAPIVAPADGIVSFAGRDGSYGRVVIIKHGYGIVTKYAHLKKALVKKGQYVKREETIALVGNSGRSTGPHLHYEVHLNKVAVDPLRYILN
ncbi:MAG: M23 family metallopeptidase [Deltaproteobacteria bacterium]|nr:M23 family metallopeptidase [Deltaproteobacteria bacterium]